MQQWILIDRYRKIHNAQFSFISKREALYMERSGWEKNFKWSNYISGPSRGYKVCVVENSTIQGAIALYDDEGFVYIDLLESAPHNRTKKRQFINVAGLLLAYACKRSFDLGFEGFVCFKPKTQLYNYYALNFKAKPANMGRMYLGTIESNELVRLYYR